MTFNWHYLGLTEKPLFDTLTDSNCNEAEKQDRFCVCCFHSYVWFSWTTKSLFYINLKMLLYNCLSIARLTVQLQNYREGNFWQVFNLFEFRPARK